MKRFWKAVAQWLVALLLGAFLLQAFAASASELCRLQCQKDWKTNVASIGDSFGKPTGKWSSFSTPCPDLAAGSDVSSESDTCMACGLCALSTVFVAPEVCSQLDVKHPPQPLPVSVHVQVWLNDGLFRPPRA